MNFCPKDGGKYRVSFQDVLLIKTNSGGDTLWVKTYGQLGSNIDMGFSVEQTVDGGYIVFGRTGSIAPGNIHAYLIKTNSNGDIEWSKKYGGDNGDYALYGRETLDGGYILAGGSNSFTTDTCGFQPCNEVYFIKTDGNGNTSCNEFNPTTIVGSAPLQLGSGSILGTGGNVLNDAVTVNWAFPTAKDPCDPNPVVEEMGNSGQGLSIYPNPTAERLTIKGTYGLPANFELYDVMGRRMKRMVINRRQAMVDVSELGKGIYLYKLTDSGGGVVTGKVVVE